MRARHQARDRHAGDMTASLSAVLMHSYLRSPPALRLRSSTLGIGHRSEYTAWFRTELLGLVRARQLLRRTMRADPMEAAAPEYCCNRGRGDLRPRGPAHVLHQDVRASGACPARPCRALASARRGRGGVRLLGDGADRVHGDADRDQRRARLSRKPQLHRAGFRLRHHGDRGEPAGHRLRGGIASALVSRLLPMPRRTAYYFTLLSVGPLLGSFITEPAAMTLTALLLRDRYFGAQRAQQLHVRHGRRAVRQCLDRRHAHALCRAAGADGGGALGPRLRVSCCRRSAGRPRIAVLINAAGATFLFRELSARAARLRRIACEAGSAGLDRRRASRLSRRASWSSTTTRRVPRAVPVLSRLRRSLQALSVAADPARRACWSAFFLAGLVVLGGQQKWWLQPLLTDMDADRAVHRRDAAHRHHRQRGADLSRLAGRRRVRASSSIRWSRAR